MACFTGKKSFPEYVCVKIAARGGANPRTASPLAAHSLTFWTHLFQCKCEFGESARNNYFAFQSCVVGPVSQHQILLKKMQLLLSPGHRLQKCAVQIKPKIFVTVVGLRKLQQLLSLAFGFFLNRRDYFEIAFFAPLHPSSSEGHLGV